MKFKQWIEEVEAYSTREERMYQDLLDNLDQPLTLFLTVRKWLEAAYEVGYDHGYEERELDEILSQASNRGRDG
jgi:hypothetical protein